MGEGKQEMEESNRSMTTGKKNKSYMDARNDKNRQTGREGKVGSRSNLS